MSCITSVEFARSDFSQNGPAKDKLQNENITQVDAIATEITEKYVHFDKSLKP